MVNGIKKLKPRLIRLLLIAAACIIVVMILTAIAQPKAVEVHDFESCVQAGGVVTATEPDQCISNGKSFTRTAQNSTAAEPYIGLPEDQAMAKAHGAGRAARVVERDGEALPVTMDISPCRLNLYVRSGEVYNVEIEGEAPK